MRFGNIYLQSEPEIYESNVKTKLPIFLFVVYTFVKILFMNSENKKKNIKKPQIKYYTLTVLILVNTKLPRPHP